MRKTGVIICLALLTAMASAKQQQAAIKVQQKAFAAITVVDIAKAAQWYQSLFDLALITDFQSPDAVVKGKILSNNKLTIELQQHKDSVPSSAPADKPYKAIGLFKFGIVISDLDKTIAELKKRHVIIRVAPFTEPNSGVLNAIITDPDGNMIQLIEG
ncbi:hypothetical protein tinsulaeT_30800 [Thalassotalea insulae]|uniref:VOC domain-containing protein n=2 Tax=Thalassotalea insulae TaxID=2056778 RepID=A0ABQ6GUX6_9GAMM|nr:hypothetical protein tinsulaeT_30800 [Thalassotalea insulae]